MTPGIERTAVIVGCTADSIRLAHNLHRDPQQGIHVLGFFDDRDAARLECTDALPLLGPLSDLGKELPGRYPKIDIIIVALPHKPRLAPLLDATRQLPATVYYLPDAFTLGLVPSPVEILGGQPLLALSQNASNSGAQQERIAHAF